MDISKGKTLNRKEKRPWLRNPRYLPALIVAIAMYFLSVRPRISPVDASQVELIAIGILLLALVIVVLIFLGTLIVALAVAARTRERIRPWLLRMRGEMIYILTFTLLLAVIVLVSQLMAYTPPILGDDGKPLPNSITFSGESTAGRRGPMADYPRPECG